MSPVIAAWLCGVFIIWLLYSDWRRSSTVSIGSWVPTIWVTIIASRPVGCWISGGDASSDPNAYLDGSPVDRNIFLALIVLGCFILVRRNLYWGNIFSSNKWLWIFYFFLFISIIWSEFPLVASKRWFKDLGNIVMILVILTDKHAVDCIRSVLLRCAFLLIPLSVLVIKYFLEVGVYYNHWTWQASYCGITTDKNALGRLAMLSGLISLWSLLSSPRNAGILRWFRDVLPEFFILLMVAWLLQIAHSATALFCAATGSCTLLLLTARFIASKSRLIYLFAAGFVLASLLFMCIPDLRAIVTSSMDRDVNLTERTDIWDGAMKLHTDPLIGAGFGSIWLTHKGRQLLEELQAAHAHNGFLETYLNTGLIGVALLGLALFRGAGHSIYQLTIGNPTGPLMLTLFLVCFVYNYAEAALNNNNFAGFLLFLTATQYEASDGTCFAEGNETAPSMASEVTCSPLQTSQGTLKPVPSSF